MTEYKKRIADQILADKLEASGAVLIEGPFFGVLFKLVFSPFCTQNSQKMLKMKDSMQNFSFFLPV